MEQDLRAEAVDAAFQAFLDDAFEAEVTVDDRIGQWDAETTTVVASTPAQDPADAEDDAGEE